MSDYTSDIYINVCFLSCMLKLLTFNIKCKEPNLNVSLRIFSHPSLTQTAFITATHTLSGMVTWNIDIVNGFSYDMQITGRMYIWNR